MSKKLAILGCGKLAEIMGDALKRGLLPGYTLSASFSRKYEDAEHFAGRFGGRAVRDVTELLSDKPDFVIETASVELVKQSCIPCLKAGASFIPLSIGAFADDDFYREAQSAAKESGAKLYIPHGAVGGFDVLRTLSLMAEAGELRLQAGISTRKGPKSLENTPLYKEKMKEKEVLAFSGSCQEAIALLPTKVNVAVAQSLCTLGPEKATAKITSVPGFVGDEHTITAEAEGLKVVSSVYSATADIAAWSIVSLLRDLDSPVSFF